MATRIQLRRDTAANWVSANPTLTAGELGYETDTYKIKLGTGSTAWNSLPYVQIALGADTTGNYVATITGTANQVSVSGSGSETAGITLSLPQDINTSSSPTFGGATLDAIRVGITTANEIDTTSGNLTIDSFGGTVTVDDNLIVSGDLTVNGTTTTVNTETINLADNIIVLNANATGAPTENAGIEVERGDSPNVVLRWNESTDTWEATKDGTTYHALVLAGDDISTSDITNFTEDVQDVVGGMVSSNTESGISVTYDDESGKLNFDVSDPTLTFTGDATGSGTVTNLGNTSIELTVVDNSHNHTASNVSDFTESVQDVVGGMVSTNTESGISVTYDDENGKLNFDVNDPLITLSGDVTGSATMTNLGNVTITTSVAANSVELGADTTGNYLATISGTANQIEVSGEGTEGRAATLSFPSSVTFPGTVTLNANPTQALQAATKQYVDAVSEGLHIHPSVQAATTANISDLSAPPAAIDNVTLTNNMRVLVKNQSTTSQNGIYVFSSSTGALTRASDFDSASEIQGGDFVFVVGGSTQDNTGWVQTEIVTTVGADPIAFQQFSGAGTYSAGTGLALNGTVFSNTGVLSVNGSAGVIADIAITTGKLSQFASTTSSELAGVISDETGTGALVFAGSPALTGTPTAPTASVDTNTTQVATTAYVVGQGYLKSATASTTYQPLDGDLTAIAGLTGTSGFLRKTAADTYTLDTNTYLTGNQSISLSGDATGTGATAITVTLANTGVVASTYGSSTAIPVISVDAKGRITGVTTSSVEGLPSQSGNAGRYLTTNGTAASWGTIEEGLNPLLLGGM